MFYGKEGYIMKVKIAITGGIGSGKSMVAAILRQKGHSVYSCDEIYKEVICSSSYVESVAKEFPTCVENGIVNRKALSDIVFNNPAKLNKLNAIAHPLIMKKLNTYMRHDVHEFVFAEVPLLFENGFEKDFEKVLVVQRDKAQRIQSVLSRDNLSENEALKRMNAQFGYDTLEGRAYIQKIGAYEIFNNSTIEDLEVQIEKFLTQL